MVRNKYKGIEKTLALEIDPFTRHFATLHEGLYCEDAVLFVSFFLTVNLHIPEYRSDDLYETYIFRADTLEFLTSYEGSYSEATPNAPSDDVGQTATDPVYLTQRFLVSCQPEAQGRPFSLTVTDRAAHLNWPEWCGKDGEACAVLPPSDPRHP